MAPLIGTPVIALHLDVGVDVKSDRIEFFDSFSWMKRELHGSEETGRINELNRSDWKESLESSIVPHKFDTPYRSERVKDNIKSQSPAEIVISWINRSTHITILTFSGQTYSY